LFMDKWGGSPGNETYKTPYNKWKTYGYFSSDWLCP
jgi:hypothetical protein